MAIVLYHLIQAHYGAKTAAAVTGLGLENVYVVKVDTRGKMLIDDLERKVEQAKSEVYLNFFNIQFLSENKV